METEFIDIRPLPAPPPDAISLSSDFEMETVAAFFRLLQDSDDNGCRAYGSVQGYMDMIGNEQLRMSASSAAACHAASTSCLYVMLYTEYAAWVQ